MPSDKAGISDLLFYVYYSSFLKWMTMLLIERRENVHKLTIRQWMINFLIHYSITFRMINHLLVAKIEIMYKFIDEQKLIVNHSGYQFSFDEIQWYDPWFVEMIVFIWLRARGKGDQSFLFSISNLVHWSHLEEIHRFCCSWTLERIWSWLRKSVVK
jgi:hypothetical protein